MGEADFRSREFPACEEHRTLRKYISGIYENGDPIHVCKKKRLPKEPRSSRSIYVGSQSDDLIVPQVGI